MLGTSLTASQGLDCKTVGFFLKIGKAWRKSPTRAKRASLARTHASFQIFCLTARAYLNKQKYGLFCSLPKGRRQ